MSWSAVAERSGDTAFARARVYLCLKVFVLAKSGGERAAVQTLREVWKRKIVAAAFGLRVALAPLSLREEMVAIYSPASRREFSRGQAEVCSDQKSLPAKQSS